MEQHPSYRERKRYSLRRSRPRAARYGIFHPLSFHNPFVVATVVKRL